MPEAMKTFTEEQWYAEGERLYGKAIIDWRFRCPSCGNVASGRDWKEVGHSANAAATVCLGKNGDGCTFSTRRAPVVVVVADGSGIKMFDFA